jgi:FAD/FMN-containing dehydrogenase
VALTTDTFASARDIADRILALDPATLTIYDGALARRAAAHGTRFSLIGDVDQLGAVVYVRFNDFNDRTRSHKLKKLRKMLKNTSTGIVSSDERPGDDFIEVRSAASYQLLSEKEGSDLPIINGAYVPEDRREEFEHAVSELSASQHIDLPLLLNIRTGTYDLFPELKLSVVSDKQKLFRLITDYSALVHIHNGACVSDGAEGRLKANATWATLDDDEIALYETVRSIFDPFSTLNPGVKQRNELRSLVSSLRSSYDQLNYLV